MDAAAGPVVFIVYSLARDIYGPINFSIVTVIVTPRAEVRSLKFRFGAAFVKNPSRVVFNPS